MACCGWIDTEKVDQRVVDFAREQLEGVGAEVLGAVANRVTKDESFNWIKYYRARAKGKYAGGSGDSNSSLLSPPISLNGHGEPEGVGAVNHNVYGNGPN